MFADVLTAILDLLYPPTCCVCRRDGDRDSLCPECWRRVVPLTTPLCSICGRPFGTVGGGDHECRDCIEQRPHFDQARGCVVYDSHDLDSPLRVALHAYKYDRKVSLARSLAAIVRRHCPLDPSAYDCTVPVPLHRDRLRWRGFNQAALLLRALSPKTGPPIEPRLLIRVRSTQPQVELTGIQRRENVARAFAVREPERVRGRRILLFDDVYTTGSTVDECAKVLKRAGALRVDVLALARAVVQ